MRVRLKGVHSVTKRLADGTRAVYRYAWRGGPRLLADREWMMNDREIASNKVEADAAMKVVGEMLKPSRRRRG